MTRCEHDNAEVTAWRAGRFDGRIGRRSRLLFGRMHEDWRLEATLFADCPRVFCIASAGCTALDLARLGHEVTAVDINPAQVDCVRRRLCGEPRVEGDADRLLTLIRRMLVIAGVRRSRLREFLLLDDPNEQSRAWDRLLKQSRLGPLLNLAMRPAVLRLAFGRPFVAALPRRFGECLLQRMTRCWATHPNRTNPYAWRLWLGCDHPAATETAEPCSLSLACADAAGYLETCPPHSFDAFTLSNIVDGSSEAYVARLWSALSRAAAPGAIVIFRSFVEPRTPAEAQWAALDRAMLWGRISVSRWDGPNDHRDLSPSDVAGIHEAIRERTAGRTAPCCTA